MWYHPPQVVIASTLGYVSIGCWLCAQLPQVLKNISLQSCEGLSLPFLVNWLFGDLTNLIGCLLTDQLPFQTYLAAYFCVIDFALLVQYFHYRRPKPIHAHTHHHHHVHYASLTTAPTTSVSANGSPQQPLLTLTSPPSASSTVQPPTRGGKRKHSSMHGYRSQSTSQIFGSELGGLGMTSPQLPVATDSYQDLYQAALDVARAAERVSSRRSESRRRRLSRQTTANTIDENGFVSGHGGTGGMMESFHSEMSGRTSSTADLENEERDKKRMTQSTGNIGLDNRGRSMRRSVITSPAEPGTPIEELDRLEGLPGAGLGEGARPQITRSKSRSLSVVRTTSGKGKGRRAAGVAFMSFGLLFGFGGGFPSPTKAPAPIRAMNVSIDFQVHPAQASTAVPIRHPQPFLHPTSARHQSHPILIFEHTGHQDEPPEPPSFQRLVGRTSAWACTTLYLTSRLPQIWKNFMRKSVEGLSIFLFFFAFCGNLTYVASILLNPAGSASPSDAGHYILEALPYLMGSGGTLLFDLTIMIQSMMYGSAPPVDENSPAVPRRKGFRRRRTAGSHLEDGKGLGQGHGHGQGERQPLLTRDRSVSPETIFRRTGSRVVESPVDRGS